MMMNSKTQELLLEDIVTRYAEEVVRVVRSKGALLTEDEDMAGYYVVVKWKSDLYMVQQDNTYLNTKRGKNLTMQTIRCWILLLHNTTIKLQTSSGFIHAHSEEPWHSQGKIENCLLGESWAP